MINKRTKLLVMPKFQISFIMYSASTSILLALIFFISHNFFFKKFIKEGMAMGIPANHAYFKLIQDQQHYMNFVFLGALLAVLACSVLYGLYMSNRIAGPIFRLTEFAKSREKSELDQIYFRKNDYFSDLANVIRKLKND